MPGPAPKPAGTRQRRNKTSTARTLTPVDPDAVTIPDLPKSRKWNKRTVERWEAVWLSPMAPEYDDSDLQGLIMVAEIWDAFYEVDDDHELNAGKRARLKIQLAAEIRLQEQRFGLSPIDRRRLQWEIDRGEAAEENTRKRRNLKAVKSGDDEEEDPRKVLEA